MRWWVGGCVSGLFARRVSKGVALERRGGRMMMTLVARGGTFDAHVARLHFSPSHPRKRIHRLCKYRDKQDKVLIYQRRLCPGFISWLPRLRCSTCLMRPLPYFHAFASQQPSPRPQWASTSASIGSAWSFPTWRTLNSPWVRSWVATTARGRTRGKDQRGKAGREEDGKEDRALCMRWYVRNWSQMR